MIYDEFYKIKSNVNNNKDLKIKNESGETITIDTKCAVNLMDLASKNTTFDEVKTSLIIRFLNQLIILSLKNRATTELSY